MMLDAHPMTGCIGAEIEGLDLSAALSEETAAELRAFLARHHVLVFRDLQATRAQQKALTRVFGPLMRLPYIPPMADDPEVIAVVKEAVESGGTFGGEWHSDMSFLERPPGGSALSARELAPYGGDTLWISQAAAWESLPDALKSALRGRDAIHVGKPYGVKWAPTEDSRSAMKMSRGDPEADRDRRHPAVLKQPDSGREMLFLNPTYVARLEGMSEDESRPLLEAVQRHAVRPEFTCRLRWQPDTLALWDNLATQHYATNDYQGFRRVMYRTCWQGAAPGDLGVG